MEPSRPEATPAPVPAPAAAARLVTPRQYLWIVGAAAVVVLALQFLGPVLTPFLVGAIFAYLGAPLVDRMQRRGLSRTLGTLLVVLLFGLAVIALLLVLVPLVQAEAALAAKKLPDLFARFAAEATPWLEKHLGIVISTDVASLREFVAEHIEEAKAFSLHIASGLKAGGIFLISLIVNVVLIPVVMFYLLRDWNMIWRRMFALVPRRWRRPTRQIATEIDQVLAEFLRGQGTVMASLALYYAIGLSIAGLQFAIPIGILTGLLVFIPYIGFGTGLVLGMLAALLQWNGLPGFLAVVAVYGVGQILENYVLIPWLIGDRIGLHPLAVIFALLAFGSLFGIAGVLLALPVSAALLVGLRHLRREYRRSALYGDDPRAS
ncbi:Putative transport protein YhhT [Burkholderiales bacterium]|nr:Putative transport protein YhhT [Burkholderiales bacterium]